MNTNEEHNNIITGVVVEALPNAMFRVILDNQAPQAAPEQVADISVPVTDTTTVVDISTESDINVTAPKKYVEPETIIAYLAGKMKFHRIRVIVGDSVDVLIDSYGGRGRIVRRHSMPDKRITKRR